MTNRRQISPLAQSPAPTDEQVQSAVDNYASEHGLATGATAEQVAQIEQNTKDISSLSEESAELKSDLATLGDATSSFRLLDSEEYNYTEGVKISLDMPKNLIAKKADTYSAYAEISVKNGEEYEICCGGLKSPSVNYPDVMLVFSADSNTFLDPVIYGYDQFCGVTENIKTRVESYSVIVPNGANKMYVCTSAKGSMPIVIRKNDIRKTAEYNGVLGHIENTSGKQYDIADLNFLYKTAQRHFFDLNKMCYEIIPNEKLFGANSNIYPKTDVQNSVDIACDSKKIRFGYWGSDTAESYLTISSVEPFRVYEVDFANVVAGGEKCRCYINFRNPSGGSYSIDIDLESGNVYFAGANITAGIDVTSGNFTTRIYIMRYSVALYFENTENGCKYAGTFDISGMADMCKPAIAEKYNMCIGAVLSANNKFEVSAIRSYITCGCAQADIRLLKDFECNPIITNGKAYLAMSCRGYEEGYGESYCGIFSFDLITFNLELTGQIFTDIDEIEHPCVGTSIIFDPRTSLWHLYYSDRHGVTAKDPRFGKTVFTNERFTHDLTDEAKYEWLEDPDVFYDKNMNRYYMIASVKEIDSSVQYPYSVAFLESNSMNGMFTLISKTNNTLGGTGTSWFLMNGKLYATSGTNTDGIAVFDGKTYAKLNDLDLNVSYGGFRTWGCIVPVFDGMKTRYALVTFDRNRGYGTFSYGNVFVYISDKANTGADYNRINHAMLIN